MKKCIVLANGQAPSKSVVNYLIEIGFDILICADGGANTSYKLGLTPNYIIGDFDSIKPEVKKYFTGKSEIIHQKSQYSTDVEKCLNFAIEKKFDKVVLLGATGDRLDHSFCNLGIVLKYFSRIEIFVVHQKSLLSAYSGQVVLNTIPGENISIYGIDTKTKITTHGLKYPLRNEALPFGVRESTSNVAFGEEAIIQIKGGTAFIIRDFQTLRKNGFLQSA
ncbi:MAG: thiamine diphosphokinase [bacterium]